MMATWYTIGGGTGGELAATTPSAKGRGAGPGPSLALLVLTSEKAFWLHLPRARWIRRRWAEGCMPFATISTDKRTAASDPSSGAAVGCAPPTAGARGD